MKRRINWKREELKRLYWEEQKTLAEIGSIYRTSKEVVWKAMSRFGIPRRTDSQAKIIFYRGGLTNLDNEELRRLYLIEQRTANEIAKIYHCSQFYVLKCLRQFGIPVRSQSEAKRIYYQTHLMPEALRRKHKGSYKTKSGYILVRSPDHPHATKAGYVLEHRLVMEKKLGRYLLPSEKVHHINGIKDDKRPENLQLVSQLDHTMRGEFCANCNLRKEIRLLRWEMKQLREQLQYKLME